MANIKRGVSLLITASMAFTTLCTGVVSADAADVGLEPGEYKDSAELMDVQETNAGFGSEQTELEAGVYNIPVTMKNASDISKDSMATACIAGSRLEVAEDGTAKLIVDLQPITVGSITASSSDWSVYQSYGVENGDNIPAAYTENEEGNVNQITFAIPDNSWDGVYVNMTSDGTHYSNAYLAIDYANAVLVGEEEKALFGSAQIELEAGIYDIPVTMKNASDISKDSMAASCIVDAQLEVLESGPARLIVNLQPVSFGSIVAAASEWKVYQSYGTGNGDAVAADYTMNEAGEVNQISFTIPDNSWDGVYVNMCIAVIGMVNNAYFAIDYANAVAPGEGVVYYGTAQVDQFGKYTVKVAVTVVDGVITSVEITGDDFSGTFADYNQAKLETAADGLKDAWNGKTASQENVNDIYEVDAVSSATISSEAIRNAVMDALSLTYTEDVINVPESVEPGIYEVEVQYYTDIVEHYLTGGSETLTGKLIVDNSGNMKLDLDIINGTVTEPLYVLDHNGYYMDNDPEKELTTDNLEITKGTTDYSDTYFAQDTPVVTHITLPLAGGPAEIYNTNVYLYVPAMNNLDGEVSGILFDHGKFNVDAFVRVHWDDIVHVGDYIPEEKPDVTQDGSYTVEFALYQESADSVSMGNIAFEENPIAVITTVDGVSTIRIQSNPVTISPYYSALKGMQFENTNGQWQAVRTVTTETITATDGENDYELAYLKELEFTLPSVTDEYIPVKIYVPYTPMEMIGDAFGYVEARLRIDWDTLAVADSGYDIVLNSAEQADGAVTVSVSNSGAEISAEAVLACYDENGRLLGIVTQTDRIVQGDSTITFENSMISEASRLKVMLWSGFSDMTPLAAALTK